jgi:hypothetical protein
MKLTPYQKHLFSRFKLRGKYATWCFNSKGWIRIHRIIIRWHLVDINAVSCAIIHSAVNK